MNNDKNTAAAFFSISAKEESYVKNLISQRHLPLETTFFSESLNPDTLPDARDFEVISVFVDCSVDRKTLNAFPKLRCIAVRSTGYDNIDCVAAAEKKISVAYVPTYGENTVAEFAFGLILNLSRKIGVAYNQVRENGTWSTAGLMGFDLKGKTLGIVGTGHIGRHIARIAQGFEMNVVAFDVHPDEKYAHDAGFRYVSLESLLGQSDIVTLHVPYMEETHHLIDAKTLQQMKRGAYLINTSRGGVVDTQALVQALRDEHLAGAGLDVLEEEGVIKDELGFLVHGHPEEHNLKTILADHALIDMPNVIVTPHNAFNTHEALNRILDTTVSNIVAFLVGKPENLIK